MPVLIVLKMAAKIVIMSIPQPGNPMNSFTHLLDKQSRKNFGGQVYSKNNAARSVMALSTFVMKKNLVSMSKKFLLTPIKWVNFNLG